MNECIEWVFECRKVFPALDKLAIEATYAKTPKKVLGRVKGTVKVLQDFDAKEFLLTGNKKTKNNKKLEERFIIEINEKLKKAEPIEIRKQIIQHITIHELQHIENKDLLTLSKKYSKRKTKKIHKKDFEEQIHSKYNALRKINGLPEIKNLNDTNNAINKIIAETLGRK